LMDFSLNSKLLKNESAKKTVLLSTIKRKSLFILFRCYFACFIGLADVNKMAYMCWQKACSKFINEFYFVILLFHQACKLAGWRHTVSCINNFQTSYYVFCKWAIWQQVITTSWQIDKKL
jgi:hypothetical protein